VPNDRRELKRKLENVSRQCDTMIRAVEKADSRPPGADLLVM